MGGFGKARGLVVSDIIDRSAIGNQETRSNELKSLVQLSSEECFCMFEMVP